MIKYQFPHMRFDQISGVCQIMYLPRLCALCAFAPLCLTRLTYAPSYALKSPIEQCFTKSQQHICNVLWRHQRLSIIFFLFVFFITSDEKSYDFMVQEMNLF